jgi:hypothetical protein
MDKKKTVITDTGSVEHLPAEKGKTAYVVTWAQDAGPPPGRPIEKDWVGVMHRVIAKVAKDGLPTGRGAQTVLAGWIHDALASKDMETSQSMAAKHARQILAEVKKIR